MMEDDGNAEETGKAKGGHRRAEILLPERRTEIARLAAEARWSSQPLRVLEDADTGDRFVVYTTKDSVQLDLRFEGDEPWFTQLQLAEMYGVSVPTVNEHIAKFRSEGELNGATIRNFRIVRQEGARTVSREIEHYGLDVAFYVGYRVNSREGKLFRRWATNMLIQIAKYGFVVDVRRLENPDGQPDYFDLLLEKIRHIRSSEKRMWTRVLELASVCSDYGMMSEKDKEDFFATIQNALHWSIVQKTAAEVIAERVDASKPNAGVTHFVSDMPTVKEAQVAKNLYRENEIIALNLVTSMALEFFESQAEQRRPTTIARFLGKMRELLKLDGRPLIQENERGRINMPDAKKKASAEIKAYKERIRLEREAEGELKLAQLSEQVKKRRSPKPKK